MRPPMRFCLDSLDGWQCKFRCFPHAVLREKKGRDVIFLREFLLFVQVKTEHFGAGIYRKLHRQKDERCYHLHLIGNKSGVMH